MKKNRIFIITLLALFGMGLSLPCSGQNANTGKANIAVLAKVTGSGQGGGQSSTLNDGLTPNVVSDQMRQYASQAANPTATQNQRGRSRRLTAQFVQYEWQNPVTIDEVQLFWFNFDNLAKFPQAHRLKYWDGKDFVPVKNAVGYELINNQYNATKFDEVTTTKLRLELDSVERTSTLLEWKVLKTLNSPEIAPVITAGIDRDVMVGGKTYLSAEIKSVDPLKNTIWSATGPGKVVFADPSALKTTATFTVPGDYVLSLSSQAGQMKSSASLKAKVHFAPKGKRLDVVYTKRYKIDSPVWNNRAKALITSWIPYCAAQIERTDLTTGQGGLDNFIEAGKALRGEPHGNHVGYVFANAWVHQTVESMCLALMVDPQGDKDIIAAQEKMKITLEKWIPIILAAQEPDGYLQTAFTLRDPNGRWQGKWTPEGRGNHEGYTAGYFIESAINHYTLTNGKDKRLYDAAKKLADCWVRNIGTGPGKKVWFDGHQEMEQALVRFGRFVNDVEGNGRGDSYVTLAKFLLDSRTGGSEYDQSHVPVIEQYEAVGHAVRAVYTYSAMSDIAAQTGDIDYQSAVMSLWNNMVNKKYYVTGGVGSGETSEGFGPNYSLGNNAYCESCSTCGLIFFQYKMNLAYHDAKYADLYEESMYNALLGSIDYEGTHFYYTNPLSASRPRDAWHTCPCCVGNIPRTLLMIPTWTYVTGDDGIYVNMYVGSTINVERVVGTDIQMVQKTDYPWKGAVSITVNPKQAKKFTVYVRVPNRKTSELYTSVPAINTLNSLSVNGTAIPMKVVNGYIAITRDWKKGDKIDLDIPMKIQQITADKRIMADSGRIALRYGPMIYNVEKADGQDISKLIGNSPLKIEWRPDMFSGTMTIKGQWADGTPLIAIPNYLRMNRFGTPTPGDRTPASIVWIKK